MKNKAKLSKHQEKAVKAFYAKNTDVSISDIFISLYGATARRGLTAREMQQKLAPTFKAINAKITPHCIIVGKTKQTYRYATRG